MASAVTPVGEFAVAADMWDREAEKADCERNAALSLVEADSRLGWEPSMDYAVGPEQIRWKLGLMERLYGKALK